jgi:hypothetical protein
MVAILPGSCNLLAESSGLLSVRGAVRMRAQERLASEPIAEGFRVI